MSPNDRPRTAEGTLEERLRAAGNALREGSAAQVDAATGLREIVHGARAVPDDQALPPADQPLGQAAAEPRATALSKPPVPASTVKAPVPEACLDAAELADEVIARLNRNQRDNALALALRDYSVASQACRRAAR